VTTADEPGGGHRLVGVRTPYGAAPPPVHAWVTETLGAPVVEVRPRVGGMSPAVAASLRGANGATAFVKAVNPAINPDTPQHFRHEIAVLSALASLPPAPYRARLLSTYDDGDWVAIALEDIDGRHPDWGSPADRASVLEAVKQQSRELTPFPSAMPADSNYASILKYLQTMATATHEEVATLPSWAADDLPKLLELGQRCLDHHRDESFCHWDIRHDNILIRHGDDQPILLDWGMSRRGQRWGDILVFALEWVDSPAFDEIMATAGLTAEEDGDVTGFIAAIGCYLLMSTIQPPPPSLPNLPAFRRQVGAACLRGVRRRTGGTFTD
jgi:serine/threonine protein kinase